jgi:hypothetical protein
LGSKGSLRVLIHQTPVHGPGGTAEVPVRYLGLRGQHRSSEASARHGTQTTRNLAAVFGDCLASGWSVGASLRPRAARPNMLVVTVVGRSTVVGQVAVALAGEDRDVTI